MLLALSEGRLAGGGERKEHAMSGKHNSVIAAIGIDIGENSFHHPSRCRFVMAACIISAAIPNIGTNRKIAPIL